MTLSYRFVRAASFAWLKYSRKACSVWKAKSTRPMEVQYANGYLLQGQLTKVAQL